MQIRRKDNFPTIRSEGGILPSDLLQRIAERDKGLEGLDPASFHLAPGERINEAAERTWSHLRGTWVAFQDARKSLPEGDTGTSLTRERWLLPLFQELGYGRLQTARAVEIEGKSYPVSHAWGDVPIHLVGCRVELDRRTQGVAGAARTNPHGLLQELLNRSEERLWGFVSNGRSLRILRDNKSLTRQSYVEFDLESMMEGETYSDFALLWLLCHQSRVEGEKPELCWLETWSKTAQAQGARAIEQLGSGVKEAIIVLGKGFLAHTANRALKNSLRSGALTRQDYYRQLLRLVYQLIFLFVAEDRDWLLDPKATPQAREMYKRFYSTAGLRQMAEGLRGTRHGDLYRKFRVVVELLDKEEGCLELALPALGSFLFAAASTHNLNDCEIANYDFLEAVRKLALLKGDNRRPVDYKNLRSEELGSVYEELLELQPKEFSVDAGTFDLEPAQGNERKTTGAYYTPDSLVQCLLDSALDPVLNEAVKKPDPEQAILDLKVCDPACGSGHFLIAAAHRMAKRLASVRTRDEEPSPVATRTAVRDIIGRCLYGVDLNPMVVELCKFALLMEAMEPGKPLLFLDRQIRCGNSLLGTTPTLLLKGIPDAAFEPIEGDNKAVCTEFKKKNREQRTGQEALFDENLMPWEELGNLAASMVRMDKMPMDHIGQIRKQEGEYADHVHSQNYENNKLWADAWCAAFVWKKQRADAPPCFPMTDDYFRRIRRNPHSIEPWMRQEIRSLANQYQFFHWHLEFPTVCRWPNKGETPENPQTGWSGGFDVVLGNPPWERIKLQEKEWFAGRHPDIANAMNASTRRKLIEALEKEDPTLWKAFFEARRQAEGESQFIRQSGRFPLTGRGDVNTYAVFAEAFRTLAGQSGRAGILVPSGIATDDTTKFFFQNLIETNSLASLFDFENRKKIFSKVHPQFKFCVLTMCGSVLPSGIGAEFAFFALDVSDLNAPERRFTLSAEDIALLNPNTKTCPIFRSRRDAEITKAIYQRVPVLIAEGPPESNPWNIKFVTLFHMANDSYLFRTARELEAEGFEREGNIYVSPYDRYLPLYEAKMLHKFDHRWTTYQTDTDSRDVATPEKQQPGFVVQPRYWVREEVVESAIPKFPEVIHRALLSGHQDSLKRALLLWTAGYYLNKEEAASARDAIDQALSLPIDRSLNSVLLINDVNAFAAKMDRLTPLTKSDVEAIRSAEDNHTEIAQELIQRFSPHWLMGWRDITNATNERTVIASLLPKTAVGHKFPLLLIGNNDTKKATCLLANLCSFALDYIARQKLSSTSLTYFYFKQFPLLSPESFTVPTFLNLGEEKIWQSWIAPRTLELVYTAWDMQPFARDCGYDGPPFLWDEERRFLIRCELDSAFFHLYGVERADVDYILDTFPIVKKKDEKDYGTYRTKETILSLYDAMASARTTGQPYQSPLNPAPGTPR